MQIAKLFGVPVKLHWSFFLLLGWVIAVNWGRPELWGMVEFVGLLWLMVAVHELGHVVAMRRYGLQVYDVTLTFLGGITRGGINGAAGLLPRQEIIVALAGPLVNLLLAAAVAPAAILTYDGTLNEWNMLLLINLILGLSNLIPAFPSDGARVLCAMLTTRLGRLNATERVGKISRYVALALLITAIATANLMWLVLAGYVWWSTLQIVLFERQKAMFFHYQFVPSASANPREPDMVPPGVSAKEQMPPEVSREMLRRFFELLARRGTRQSTEPGSESEPSRVRIIKIKPNSGSGFEDAEPDTAPPTQDHIVTRDGRHFYKGQELL